MHLKLHMHKFAKKSGCPSHYMIKYKVWVYIDINETIYFKVTTNSIEIWPFMIETVTFARKIYRKRVATKNLVHYFKLVDIQLWNFSNVLIHTMRVQLIEHNCTKKLSPWRGEVEVRWIFIQKDKCLLLKWSATWLF